MGYGTVQIVLVVWDPLWLAKVIQHKIYIKLYKLPIFDVFIHKFYTVAGQYITNPTIIV
jgi:hypothetical protein